MVFITEQQLQERVRSKPEGYLKELGRFLTPEGGGYLLDPERPGYKEFFAKYKTRSKRKGWHSVRQTWDDAVSFGKSVASRAVASVDQDARTLRVISCHGDQRQGIPPCPSRNYSSQGKFHYCNDCGCGEREMARLSMKGSGENHPALHGTEFIKLDYPFLECPRRRRGFSNSPDLGKLFDRVVIISLKRRKDRLERAVRELNNANWPFAWPTIFTAVDGEKVPPPAGWNWGGGTWGCMQSHRHVLEQAIADNVNSVLILEDDVVFSPGFVDELERFVSDLPSDWDGLMIGGQHVGNQAKPTSNPNVVQCDNTQRTHCYAVRGKYLRDLYKHLISTDAHCDWRMGEIQKNYKVYAPAAFLAHQGEGKSDINGADNPRKSWSPVPADAPVVLLRCPRDVMDKLRDHGFHCGRYRQPDTGYDVGLAEICLEDSPRAICRRLTGFLTTILDEANSYPGWVATVWHPKIEPDFIKVAVNRDPVVITGESVEDVLKQWEAWKVAGAGSKGSLVGSE